MATYSSTAEAVGSEQANRDAMFKKVFEDRIANLTPDGKKLLQRIKFVKKDKQLGGSYSQPVVLGMELGITHAGSDEGAFALELPVPGNIKEAVVKGYQMVLRSTISYAQAQRSAGAGEKAFEEAHKHVVGSMLDSLQKRLEIQCLYGGVELAKIVGAPVGNDITLVQSEFAEGIFAGCVGMPIDVYPNGSSTLRLSTVIQNINTTTRVLTISASTSGAAISTIAANDRIFFKGSFGKEMMGIHAILSNTSTAFNIDASLFDLWKGTLYAPATTSVLSMAIIQSAVAAAVPKGLDSDVIVLCNPGHWDDLLKEQTDLRRHDASYDSSEVKGGAKTIKIYTQAGLAEIVPSIYVKQGYSYVLPLEDWKRVGSTDITFNRPGGEGKFFKDLEAHSGTELRAYSDQAIFCLRPGRSVLISNLKVTA